MAAFFLLMKVDFVRDIVDINGLYTEYIVALSSRIIGLIGLPCAYQGSFLKLPTITLDVRFGCNGLEVAMIFVIALLVYPASWKKKLTGISLGLVFLQGINLIRIAGLAYSAEYHRSMFHLLHLYVGQAMMFVVVLLGILCYMGLGKGISKNIHKNRIVVSFSIFVVSYLLSLALWLPVKGAYNKGLAYMASSIAAFVINDVRFEGISEKQDALIVSFYIYHPWKAGKVNLKLEGIGTFASSTPLIFGIFGGLFFFVQRRKRAYAEGIFLLFFLHVLYAVSMEIMGLSTLMAKEGIENSTGVWMWIWYFLVDYAIWLIPFFIGAITFLRFSPEWQVDKEKYHLLNHV